MQTSESAESEHWIWELVLRHESALILYTGRLLGDMERARDVVQDAFLQLCRNVRPEHPRRWLYTVCRNRAQDVRRKERRMTSLEENVERVSREPAPGAALECEERSTAVLDLLAALPSNQREVLRLKFQGGLSYREIAEVTHLTMGNVGFLIYTALNSLRERLAGKAAEGLLP